MSDDNKYEQPTAPPPPVFLGEPEKDFSKHISEEIMERVIGQQIFYFAVNYRKTNYHPLYKEAIHKICHPPLRVHVLAYFEEGSSTDRYGIDVRQSVDLFFSKKRLTNDHDLLVREGDYVKYGENIYVISSLVEDREHFGDNFQRFEVKARCLKARRGDFTIYESE